MRIAAARISGCALGAQRRSKKFCHSVAVTMTVCHRKGSRIRLSSCLCTLRSSSSRARATASSRARSQIACAATASSSVKTSEADMPALLRPHSSGDAGSRSTRSIKFAVGTALELALFRELCTTKPSATKLWCGPSTSTSYVSRKPTYSIDRRPTKCRSIVRLPFGTYGFRNRRFPTVAQNEPNGWLASVPLTANSACRVHVAISPGLRDKLTASSKRCHPFRVRNRWSRVDTI